jgi:Protein of unknown function (DUF1064)
MSGLSPSDVAQLYRNQGREVPAELQTGSKPEKRHKYGRIKKESDEITFDSTSEANAYTILKLWESAGAISDLRLQPTFTLQERFKDSGGKTVRGIRYSADFQFFDKAENRIRYVDVKGVITAAFERTIKLMKDKHPTVTIEVWDRTKIKELSRC